MIHKMIHHFRKPNTKRLLICGETFSDYKNVNPFPENREAYEIFVSQYLMPKEIRMCEHCMEIALDTFFGDENEERIKNNPGCDIY